jgi:hypothetical protein
MIFNNRNFDFKLQGQDIEVFDTYSYVGLIFKCNGIFLIEKRMLVNQAQKALYSLCKKIRNQVIPTDLELKLFDVMVQRILADVCEIWRFDDL